MSAVIMMSFFLYIENMAQFFITTISEVQESLCGKIYIMAGMNGIWSTQPNQDSQKQPIPCVNKMTEFADGKN